MVYSAQVCYWLWCANIQNFEYLIRICWYSLLIRKTHLLWNSRSLKNCCCWFLKSTSPNPACSAATYSSPHASKSGRTPPTQPARNHCGKTSSTRVTDGSQRLWQSHWHVQPLSVAAFAGQWIFGEKLEMTNFWTSGSGRLSPSGGHRKFVAFSLHRGWPLWQSILCIAMRHIKS